MNGMDRMGHGRCVLIAVSLVWCSGQAQEEEQEEQKAQERQGLKCLDTIVRSCLIL